MLLRETASHESDCYFCLSTKSGFGKHMQWSYPTRSADGFTLAVLHSEEIANAKDEGTSCSQVISSSPRPWNQDQLNDVIRDLGLSKKSSELLASRMKETGLITKETKVSYYRTHEEGLLHYFAGEDDFVYCTDISGLMTAMGLQRYDSNEWRLFIDSSKRSLKCVLLHNGNK